jgi:chemotaxis protein MotB
MARKKKCPDPPPEGAPAWMTTYGDMVTLLLTFFVLLISFSSVQEAKFKKAMRSLQGALGVLNATGAAVIDTGNNDYVSRNPQSDDIQKAISQLNQLIEASQKGGLISVERQKERIHIRISNPMLFDSGSAQVKEEVRPILTSISALLKLTPYEVRVEGHTDSIPIATAVFPSNWELSSARAAAVVREFASEGVAPTRFLAVGFAEYQPIASNATEEGRAQNRRVEIYMNLKKMQYEELRMNKESTDTMNKAGE